MRLSALAALRRDREQECLAFAVLLKPSKDGIFETNMYIKTNLMEGRQPTKMAAFWKFLIDVIKYIRANQMHLL
jgi:hypothetical protein